MPPRQTKLPLARWAEFFNINPIHFWQSTIPALENATCGSGWFEYDWQDSDRVSRSQLAEAIARAEATIEDRLGYRLLPTWEVDEYHSFDYRPLRPEFFNLTISDVRGRNTGIRLDWGYYIVGGLEVAAVVEAGAAVAYSDADGDAYKETATVTVAVTAGQDPEEIEVYYPGKSGAKEWEIRPVTVSVVGAAATITFRKELAVLPEKRESFDPRGVDYTDDANYLATVDVYRRYNDPSQQVTFLWEATDCDCDAADCPSCGFNTQAGCIRIRNDDRQSFVSMRAANWDAATETFTEAAWVRHREPDAARVWYRAGYRDKAKATPFKTMDDQIARAVCVLSASYLDRKVCDCRGVQDGIAHWQRDLAFIRGATEFAQVQLSKAQLDCEFGTTAGALEAWRILTQTGGRSAARAPIGRAILA